jgi:hypothetical protein
MLQYHWRLDKEFPTQLDISLAEHTPGSFAFPKPGEAVAFWADVRSGVCIDFFARRLFISDFR